VHIFRAYLAIFQGINACTFHEYLGHEVLSPNHNIYFRSHTHDSPETGIRTVSILYVHSVLENRDGPARVHNGYTAMLS